MQENKPDPLFPFQLQEAFAKGLLKPGMNVLVDKPKKFVNNMVSEFIITNLKCQNYCPALVYFSECLVMMKERKQV